MLSAAVPAFAQGSTQEMDSRGNAGSGTDTLGDRYIDTDGTLMEKPADPRKALSSRPVIVPPSGKACEDSLLNSINHMDIPNQGQFPNPDNPNGYNDGTLNNNNGELPQRMNCNAINDIAPREETLDDDSPQLP